MLLNNLQLFNFRNYAELSVDFCKGINCITGENGSGKTNILDAIHFLSMTKGYFNASDSHSIRIGEASMMVRGQLESENGVEIMSCSVRSGHKKSFLYNELEYEKMSDHIGVFPSVTISPRDLELATEGGEYRRRFMDSIISQYDRNYLVSLIKYNELLSQRNSLLKKFALSGFADWQLMSVFDEQLHRFSETLTEIRRQFIDLFNPVFNQLYGKLSAGKESPDVRYVTQLTQGGLMESLLECRKRDLDLQYTSVGNHRDDLEFRLNGQPIKRFASQGQLKTFVTAIKLAQFNLIANHSGKLPVLLFDEVFDRMDDQRIARMLELVGEESFGQLFMTHTSYNRLLPMLEKSNREFLILEVNNNQIQKLKGGVGEKPS